MARLLQAMIYHTWCGAQYQCFSEYPIIFSPIVKFAGRCRAVQQQEWWLCHRRRRRRHSSYGRRNWVLALLPRHGGGAGGAGGNGRSIGRSVVGTRSRSSLHTRGAHVKLCYAMRDDVVDGELTGWPTIWLSRCGAAAYPVVAYVRTEAVSSALFASPTKAKHYFLWGLFCNTTTLVHTYCECDRMLYFALCPRVILVYEVTYLCYVSNYLLFYILQYVSYLSATFWWHENLNIIA